MNERGDLIVDNLTDRIKEIADIEGIDMDIVLQVWIIVLSGEMLLLLWLIWKINKPTPVS